MSGFFKRRWGRVVLCIAAALLAVVAVSNGVFAHVALKEQKGVAVCEEWSPQNPYAADYAQSLEAGGEDFKILCLTDIHIRNHATFGAAFGVNLVLDGMSRLQLKRLIHAVRPDLIVVGGDTVLTAWNDICTQQFADFMEGFAIPWAPIFGNHDYEGRADKARLSEIYENAAHCLFQSGPAGMNGMGNYIVNITRNGGPVYSLFLMDDGQYRITDGKITDGGVGPNQIEWYRWAVNGIAKAAGAPVPNMAFLHVPVPEFLELQDAYQMGQRGEDSCTAAQNDGFFDVFRENNGSHLFAGHDHNNNFIREYEGVTLGYLTKSSYNCYFDFQALGATLLTLDAENQVKTEIIPF